MESFDPDTDETSDVNDGSDTADLRRMLPGMFGAEQDDDESSAVPIGQRIVGMGGQSGGDDGVQAGTDEDLSGPQGRLSGDPGADDVGSPQGDGSDRLAAHSIDPGLGFVEPETTDDDDEFGDPLAAYRSKDGAVGGARSDGDVENAEFGDVSGMSDSGEDQVDEGEIYAGDEDAWVETNAEPETVAPRDASAGKNPGAQSKGVPAGAKPGKGTKSVHSRKSGAVASAGKPDADRGLLNRSSKTDYADYTFQGGDRSFRNNNPGNITRGDIAKRNGAIGYDKGGFAIFPDWQSGLKAQNDLWHTHDYQDRTLKEAADRWTAGDPRRIQEPYETALSKAAGVPPGTKISSLTPEQLQRVQAEQVHREGRTGGKIIYKKGRTLAQVATSWTAGQNPTEQKAYIETLSKQLGIAPDARIESLTPDQLRQIENAQVRYMGYNLRAQPTVQRVRHGSHTAVHSKRSSRSK